MSLYKNRKCALTAVAAAGMMAFCLCGCNPSENAEDAATKGGVGTVATPVPAPTGTLPPMTAEQRAIYDKMERERAAGMKSR